MTYTQAVEFFDSFLPFGIKPGLERIRALCAALGDPQNSLKFIHVAGTNGKGSVSTMLAEVFSAAGYKTGLFTSPYVLDFRERFRIDGKMIPEDELIRAAEITREAVKAVSEKGIEPTEFEVITAAALYWFKERHCDIVVLETGLGGRFDATNIVENKLACVITPLSLDHTKILGDTLEKIAAEKCGIFRAGCPVITCADQDERAMNVISEKAAELSCPVYVSENPSMLGGDIYGTDALFGDVEIRVPLMGEHMAKNAAEAVLCAEKLGVDERYIKEGIENAKMTARMEIFGEDPLSIRDGGHNEACAEALKKVLEKISDGRNIIAVCGMMSDKDYDAYLSRVAPLCDILIAVTPKNPRALKAEKLAHTAKKYCKDVRFTDEPKEGLDMAKSICPKDGLLIVCGSFYLMSDLFT